MRNGKDRSETHGAQHATDAVLIGRQAVGRILRKPSGECKLIAFSLSECESAILDQVARESGASWREPPPPLDLIRALRDALHDATEWMDGCGVQHAWPESIETGTALAQAEDWLAENGA